MDENQNPYKPPESGGTPLRRWRLSKGYRVLALSIAVPAGMLTGFALGLAGMAIGIAVPWGPDDDARYKLQAPIYVGGLLGYVIVELVFRKEPLPEN